jgi:hypothetical protein
MDTSPTLTSGVVEWRKTDLSVRFHLIFHQHPHVAQGRKWTQVWTSLCTAPEKGQSHTLTLIHLVFTTTSGVDIIGIPTLG